MKRRGCTTTGFGTTIRWWGGLPVRIRLDCAAGLTYFFTVLIPSNGQIPWALLVREGRLLAPKFRVVHKLEQALVVAEEESTILQFRLLTTGFQKISEVNFMECAQNLTCSATPQMQLE